MLKVMKLFAVIVIACLLYLIFWPVPIEPTVWHPSTDPGYTGVYAANNRLDGSERLSMGAMSGPEAAVQTSSGDVIATSEEGWLVRFVGGSGTAEPWVELGGRPLGLDIDGDGNIWVANAYLGLQKVTPQGHVSVELNLVDGLTIGYADDVAIMPNGLIYLSDATTRFYPSDWGGAYPASQLDILEHGKTGRVIEYNPISKQARIILTGLSFANGVAADPDGQFILVNETGEYRVWKLWLSGEKKGEKEIILRGLPGFPDNIHAGHNGVFWLGIVGPRSADIDALAGNKFARKIVARLLNFIDSESVEFGMVVGINSRGEVVHNLQASRGSVYATTGLLETGQHIYISSLNAPFLAKIAKDQAGL